MIYVRFNTHVTDHSRFTDADAYARDLWTWGMLYAGKHETDGDLAMSAVLASPWGYGGKANLKAAQKLVDVGLWERTETGFRICRWAEQGNKTRAQLAAAREKERAKKAGQRTSRPPECPSGTPQGTPEGVLNSSSSSPSGIRSSLGASPPEWFAVGVVATVEQVTGRTVDQVPARWVEYLGSRDRKQWAMTAKDAVAWLTAVMRAEARESTKTRVRGAEATKQPYDPEAPWMKAAGGED